MYLGVVVETGSREELFNNPIHPYTKELLEAIPVPNPRRRHSVGSVSSGDPAARRPYAQAISDGLVPKLHEINASHWVAWPQE
jgi:peptide/nickel transport system ATP-binding protein